MSGRPEETQKQLILTKQREREAVRSNNCSPLRIKLIYPRIFRQSIKDKKMHSYVYAVFPPPMAFIYITRNRKRIIR
jgi:hypothetical protein